VGTTRFTALLLALAVALTGIATLGVLAVPAAGAAQDVGAAIPAPQPSGGAVRSAAACAKQARRGTRRMSRDTARGRRRRATRARAIRRRCLNRLRRAAARRRSKPRLRPAAGPLAIGVDGHYGGWSEDEIEDRAALGAAVTRHEWDIEEPPTAEEQQVLAAATEVHTRIHALLGGNDIGDAAHYRDWVVAFVRYWGPGGSFWDAHPELDESRYAITSIELGNEPYFGTMTPADYADTVRPTLEAVAALGVPVKVILPSYVNGERTTWIDTLYERIPDLNSLFYAFADHPYWYGHDPAEPGDNGPFERIDTLRRRMDEHGAGSKPIYITEYGESTASCGSECVSEATQAAHLQEMLEAVISRDDWGVEMLCIFQLSDRGTDSGDRERQFGLLRQNGTEKPAYTIVHDAMQQYHG
jgi:hypothetical protein